MVGLGTTGAGDRIGHWLARAEKHDPLLYRHSILVGELTWRFTRYLGRSAPYCDQLYRAALLHDVGKLAIPARVLQKSAPLTADEMRLVKAHPHEGYKMLVEEGGYDDLTKTVARDHHERLDGTGYPVGITAQWISEAVRIVTICDVFAAMTEQRPYGETFTPQGAIDRMRQKKRTRLDMCLVRHFETMTTRYQPVDLEDWSKRWTKKLDRAG